MSTETTPVSTETATSETTNLVAAVQSKPRNPSVSNEKLIDAIVAGSKDGKTNAEVAESLGMKPDSFNTRKSNLNKRLKAQGLRLPELKSNQGNHGPRGADVGSMLQAALAKISAE